MRIFLSFILCVIAELESPFIFQVWFQFEIFEVLDSTTLEMHLKGLYHYSSGNAIAELESPFILFFFFFFWYHPRRGTKAILKAQNVSLTHTTKYGIKHRSQRRLEYIYTKEVKQTKRAIYGRINQTGTLKIVGNFYTNISSASPLHQMHLYCLHFLSCTLIIVFLEHMSCFTWEFFSPQ